MKRRVIVVDDVPEILTFFKALIKRLRTTQIEIVTFTDPRRAHAEIARGQHHLLIADLRMPGVSGIDLLLESLRAAPAAKRVLMSGYNELPVDRALAEDARVHAYLSKPLHAHATLLLLHAALASGQGLDEWTTEARAIEAEARRSGGALELRR